MPEDHPTCNDEDCEICQARERAVYRKIAPGVQRVFERIKPVIERRRKMPRA